jgi:hypothetical protein
MCSTQWQGQKVNLKQLVLNNEKKAKSQGKFGHSRNPRSTYAPPVKAREDWSRYRGVHENQHGQKIETGKNYKNYL